MHYELREVVKSSSHEINGGAQAVFGGKSRVAVPFVIPPNAVSIIYTVIASKTDKASPWNLVKDGLALYASANGVPVSDIASKVVIPAGTASCDVHLIPSNQENNFLNKGEFSRYSPYTRQNMQSGTFQIDLEGYKSRDFSLGLINPSSLEGISVNVQAQAFVKVTTKNPNFEKSQTLSKLAVDAYRLGSIDQAEKLNNKALVIDTTCLKCKFYKSVFQMVKDDDKCLESTTDAVSLLSSYTNTSSLLTDILSDLEKSLIANPSLKFHSLVKNMIEEARDEALSKDTKQAVKGLLDLFTK